MIMRVHNNDSTDHVDYEADCLDEIMEMAKDRMRSPGWKDGWSEEIRG